MIGVSENINKKEVLKRPLFYWETISSTAAESISAPIGGFCFAKDIVSFSIWGNSFNIRLATL